MEIKKVTGEKENLRFVVNSNEETLFSLLKTYLEAMPETDIVGVYKEHHLVDKTEFFLKVKKGDAEKFFKKALAQVKEELAKLKVE